MQYTDLLLVKKSILEVHLKHHFSLFLFLKKAVSGKAYHVSQIFVSFFPAASLYALPTTF